MAREDDHQKLNDLNDRLTALGLNVPARRIGRAGSRIALPKVQRIQCELRKHDIAALRDRVHAAQLLLWARTIEQHRLSWEAWLESGHAESHSPSIQARRNGFPCLR